MGCMCKKCVEESEGFIVQMYDSSGGERFMSGPFFLWIVFFFRVESGAYGPCPQAAFPDSRVNIVCVPTKVKLVLKLY